MKRLMCLAVLVATAVSCAAKDENDGSAQAAVQALPTKDTLSIAFPDSAEKVGDVALSYLLTRTVADTLNGGVGLVLLLAKSISEYPVTSIEEGALIWGPWSEALHAGEYRMTARLTTDGDWNWALEGRAKGSADPFQAIVSGVATPGHPHRGSGSFTLDCDVAQAIDPYGGCDDGGSLSVTYDLEHAPVTIVLDAEHAAPMPDGSSAPQTFHYEYAAASDGSGKLSFTQFADTDDPGPAWETTDYTSAWTAAGAGRTDLSVSGGDLGDATVAATECWDTSFLRTYYADSAGWLPTEGSPAACPF